MNSDSIISILNNVETLPTLPGIALEVIRLTRDTNTSVPKLVSVIEKDLSLSGHLLRIANSPYYGVPKRIDNLSMAIIVLGADEIKDLVARITFVKIFSTCHSTETFDLTWFWKHCAAVAELTNALYYSLGIERPGGAYISGLLHDVGKLVLNQFFNEQFNTVAKMSEERKIPHHQAEMVLFGFDHGDIGSWLIDKWNLPGDIITAVKLHHKDSDDTDMSIAAFVKRADMLSYALEKHPETEIPGIMENEESWKSWLKNYRKTTGEVIENMLEQYKITSELRREYMK